MAAIQLLPGIIVVSLGDLARRGNPTAFFVIFATAVLAPVRSMVLMFFGSHGSVGVGGWLCDLYTSAPLVWLGWTCAECMGEMRQLLRQRRDDRLATHRGFEPVMPADLTAIVTTARIAPVLTAQVAPPQVAPPQVAPPQVAPPQVAPPQVAPPQVAPQVTAPVVPRVEYDTPRRKSMSHYMHLASEDAKLVAIISVVGGVLLLALNLVFNHQRGFQLLNQTTLYVLIYYLMPAGLLVVLSWRMDRQDLWAFLLCPVLSLGLIARWIISLAMARTLRMEFAHLSYTLDFLSRMPFIYLLVKSLGALPDAWDIRKQYRREAAINRGEIRE